MGSGLRVLNGTQGCCHHLDVTGEYLVDFRAQAITHDSLDPNDLSAELGLHSDKVTIECRVQMCRVLRDPGYDDFVQTANTDKIAQTWNVRTAS